jgi:hypothetical protein
MMGRSCGKLAYSDAQSIIEGGKLADGKVEGYSTTEIEGDIRALHVSFELKNVDPSADDDYRTLPVNSGKSDKRLER